MKTLEQIKNDYAVSKGFKDWKYLQIESYPHQLNEYINEVMIIAQKECLKLAAYHAGNDSVTYNLIDNENNIIK